MRPFGPACGRRRTGVPTATDADQPAVANAVVDAPPDGDPVLPEEARSEGHRQGEEKHTRRSIIHLRKDYADFLMEGLALENDWFVIVESCYLPSTDTVCRTGLTSMSVMKRSETSHRTALWRIRTRSLVSHGALGIHGLTSGD